MLCVDTWQGGVGFQPEHQWETLRTNIKVAISCPRCCQRVMSKGHELHVSTALETYLKLSWPRQGLRQIGQRSPPWFFSRASYGAYNATAKIKLLRLFPVATEPSKSKVLSEYTKKYISGCEGQICILNLEKEDRVAYILQK